MPSNMLTKLPLRIMSSSKKVLQAVRKNHHLNGFRDMKNLRNFKPCGVLSPSARELRHTAFGGNRKGRYEDSTLQGLKDLHEEETVSKEKFVADLLHRYEQSQVKQAPHQAGHGSQRYSEEDASSISDEIEEELQAPIDELMFHELNNFYQELNETHQESAAIKTHVGNLKQKVKLLIDRYAELERKGYV